MILALENFMAQEIVLSGNWRFPSALWKTGEKGQKELPAPEV
jgi:hypothetical protein